MEASRRHYPCLTTLIDARFKCSLCRAWSVWASSINFHPAEPYGTQGALFRKVAMCGVSNQAARARGQADRRSLASLIEIALVEYLERNGYLEKGK